MLDEDKELFPGANPGSATWQEQDLNRDMHCGNDSATFFFDLSLYESVDWLKDVTVTVTREYGILKDLVKEVTDFSTKEVQLDSLCPGTDYFICLNFNPSLSERRNVFCQVRHSVNNLEFDALEPYVVCIGVQSGIY